MKFTQCPELAELSTRIHRAAIRIEGTSIAATSTSQPNTSGHEPSASSSLVAKELRSISQDLKVEESFLSEMINLLAGEYIHNTIERVQSKIPSTDPTTPQVKAMLVAFFDDLGWSERKKALATAIPARIGGMDGLRLLVGDGAREVMLDLEVTVHDELEWHVVEAAANHFEEQAEKSMGLRKRKRQCFDDEEGEDE